jgi:hypothetical protein
LQILQFAEIGHAPHGLARSRALKDPAVLLGLAGVSFAIHIGHTALRETHRDHI